MGASERFRNCIGGRSAPPGLLLPHLIMGANGHSRNRGLGITVRLQAEDKGEQSREHAFFLHLDFTAVSLDPHP